ncbi:hypothetical protein ABG067_009342, partial [Albugo candida]
MTLVKSNNSSSSSKVDLLSSLDLVDVGKGSGPAKAENNEEGENDADMDDVVGVVPSVVVVVVVLWPLIWFINLAMDGATSI